MFCTKCGTQINEGAKFCPKCGAPRKGKTTENREPEKQVQKKAVGSTAVIAFLAALIVLLLVGIGGGVYYFLTHNDEQDIRVEVDEEEDEKSKDGTENEPKNQTIDGINDEAEGVAKESDGDEMNPKDAAAVEESAEEYDWRNEQYILSGSAEYEITESDLQGLTPEQLRIARNEIYARHGRRFLDEELNEWFYSKEWYQELPEKYSPEEFDSLSPNPLSKLERKNAAFISEYEKKLEEMTDYGL